MQSEDEQAAKAEHLEGINDQPGDQVKRQLAKLEDLLALKASAKPEEVRMDNGKDTAPPAPKKKRKGAPTFGGEADHWAGEGGRC